MIDNPLFSIIIPIYNVEKYLPECIERVIKQSIDTLSKAEIILIDDGSTDNSSKLCDEYQKKYPDNICVIHKKNAGLLMARRTGFECAKGKYIINCDSDDYIAEDTLENLEKIVSNTSADVIFYNIVIFDEENKKDLMFENVFSDRLESVVDKESVLDDYLLSYHIVSMCCKAFKRTCLDISLDYEKFGRLGFGEDALQSLEVYSNANNFVYLNKPLYYYRQGYGMTDSFKENYFDEFKKVFVEIENTSKKWELSDIDNKLAVKFFGILGRSITQGKEKKFTYGERKKYLEKLRNDDYVEKYIQLFQNNKNKLSKSHSLVCSLLIKKWYLVLHLLLKIRR